MATVQVIEEGFRNYIIKVTGTGAEIDAKIVDVSALNPPCTRVRLKKITYSLDPADSMELKWDATSPEIFLNLNGSNDADMCFEGTAGIPNNAGAGVTGDILLNGGTSAYTLYISFIKSNS
jgi:hypothetical protein